MKKLIILFLICVSLNLFAQTITISNGPPANCFNTTMTRSGPTLIGGQNRYTYTAGAQKIIFVAATNRWEVQDGTFIEFYSTFASYPKPPSTSIGNWLKDAGSPCNAPLILSGDIQTVLPIKLAQFDAQNTEGAKNNLTWRTESEKDNRHFDIERSTDGSTFHNIGQVKGNNKPSSYQFVDNQPFAMSYYRLRQIDFDGTETVSKVVSVALKGKSKGLKVYPTLVSNGILTVVIARDEATEGGQLRDFSVMNLLGQQVLVGKIPPSGAWGLDVSALAKGTYMLKVGSEVAKFVKQ